MPRNKPPMGVPINWSDPLATDLAVCWLMNEGGGDTVYDLSGNGRHLTLTPMAFPSTLTSGWGLGPHGPAVMFDGVDDGSQSDDQGMIMSAGTVSGWLYRGEPDVIDAPSRQFLHFFAGVNEHFDIIYSFITDAYSFTVEAGGTTEQCAIAPAIMPRYTWNHVLMTWEDASLGSFMKVYANGLLQDTQTAMGTWNPASTLSNCRLGHNPNGLQDGECGWSNVYVHTRSVTDAEAMALYLNTFQVFDWPRIWYVPAVVGNPWYAYAQQ